MRCNANYDSQVAYLDSWQISQTDAGIVSSWAWVATQSPAHPPRNWVAQGHPNEFGCYHKSRVSLKPDLKRPPPFLFPPGYRGGGFWVRAFARMIR